MAGKTRYDVSILAHLNVSRTFQETIDSTLRKSRVPNRDLLGKLAIRFAYHIPRDWYEQRDKAAVVGKLVIQGRDKLGIGKKPDVQDVERAKIFLDSEEGVIWMTAWFEPRDEQVRDPKKQHKSLVIERLQVLQLRNLQVAQTMSPHVATTGAIAGAPCPVCFGARCGRGFLCQGIGPNASHLIETPARDAIQQPNRIHMTAILDSGVLRPLTDIKVMAGVLLVGFVTSAVVWVRRQAEN